MKARFSGKVIRRVMGFVGLAGVSAGFFACGEAEPESPAPRLVILYSTCTVNKDYLSPYNRKITFTPHLQRFAQGSMVFTRHQTEAGQSGPAFASIFTGTQAYRHGVYRHPTKLMDEAYLISEAFADGGYETFFWNGHGMASVRLNYGQGVREENTFDRRLSADDPKFLEILERLESDKDYRAFVLTNFTTTHSPYAVGNLAQFHRLHPAETEGLDEEEFREYRAIYNENRRQLQWNFPETIERLQLSKDEVLRLVRVIELLYKSRVHHLDVLFGKLLGQLSLYGILDDSLVVFTADHGETLYREDRPFKWTHGLALMPEALGVPLMIRSPDPDLKPGVYAKVTRSIDVFPTVAGLSGVTVPQEIDVEGVDLSPVLRGRQPPPDLSAYSYVPFAIIPKKEREMYTLHLKHFPSDGPEQIWVSIREKDAFYRWRRLDGNGWGTEAFDLASDPAATRNLFNPDDPHHREMEKRLRAYKTLLVESCYEMYPDKVRHGPGLPKEQIEALKELGYL
ncbi:MAG: sulfatase-like hydrolase/transferase [bacterium]|nr:sulfatase-like hydrolase/transferase [bacterium]